MWQMTTYIKKKGGQTLNEQLCLCKSLTTWYFYDMFMRMSAIFMRILSFMAVVRQYFSIMRYVKNYNQNEYVSFLISVLYVLNLYSKFDDTNKLTSNLIIITVHAYLNEIYKVIKNGTRNEIK